TPQKIPFQQEMSANNDKKTNTKNNVLTVPIKAVTTREKGTDNVSANKNNNKKTEDGIQENEKTTLSSDLDEVVFVLQKDGTVKKVKVKTDIKDINYIEEMNDISEV